MIMTRSVLRTWEAVIAFSCPSLYTEQIFQKCRSRKFLSGFRVKRKWKEQKLWTFTCKTKYRLLIGIPLDTVPSFCFSFFLSKSESTLHARIQNSSNGQCTQQHKHTQFMRISHCKPELVNAHNFFFSSHFLFLHSYIDSKNWYKKWKKVSDEGSKNIFFNGTAVHFARELHFLMRLNPRC